MLAVYCSRAVLYDADIYITLSQLFFYYRSGPKQRYDCSDLDGLDFYQSLVGRLCRVNRCRAGSWSRKGIICFLQYLCQVVYRWCREDIPRNSFLGSAGDAPMPLKSALLSTLYAYSSSSLIKMSSRANLAVSKAKLCDG